MIERLKKELGLIEQEYGGIEIAEDFSWFKIKKFPLVAGWSKQTCNTLVLIPPGYFTTPPDNFYTDNDLRLENGSLPGATSPNQSQIGQSWLQFSYHVKGNWQPHADIEKGHNLLTFLLGVNKRLHEVS